VVHVESAVGLPVRGADAERMAVTAVRPQPAKTIVLTEQWRRFTRTRDREVRDQLILAYSPIVKYVAGRIAGRMPAHVELADLVSYGLGGLIGAVERFDPARGVKFETYSAQRIRGAIFDELRSLDWVPRAVREEARDIDEATAALSARLRRTPTDGELAVEMGLDPTELQASLQRVADSHLLALDESWGEEGDLGSTRLERLADPTTPDPAGTVDGDDLRERIAEAIATLPERERVILALRYDQGMKNGEIGEVLGVSESRVCQLHARAVRHMRGLLSSEPAPEGA
jgi:RNA polymerase sigma factor FliA